MSRTIIITGASQGIGKATAETFLEDGWTVVTRDRSLSAQWEHTVLVTSDGHEVLTRLDGDDI